MKITLAALSLLLFATLAADALLRRRLRATSLERFWRERADGRLLV